MTYFKIAAGAKGGMGGMTRHMLAQTVPKEVADLSRYYTRENELGENEARLRRDMHPVAAAGLGVDPEKPVGMDEINALLSGHKADGTRIEGKTYSEFREYIDPKTGENKTKVPIGSVDFCLTPDKSVSVAWAFSTPAEQAAIYQAHSDAANATMAYVENHLAKAGRGKGGKDGHDQGHLAWIEFDHYTSRPTVDIVVQVDGQNSTERVMIDVPGDMDLHRHYTVMNAVFCDNGRVGSIDLDRLEGFVKRAGALYQAHLATNLRNMGAHVEIDQDTGSARLTIIPDNVRTHYSKRTTQGEDAAREYALKQGLDWDTLSDERRAGLLKKGTQGMPNGLSPEQMAKLKKDDMADFESWRQQAEQLNWKLETIIETGQSPGQKVDLSPEVRLDNAHPTAAEWLEKDLNKRAVISEHEVYIAAARGLIVHGIDTHKDLDGVVSRMMERGVLQEGEKTTLIVGQETGKKYLSFTTALHESDEAEFISRGKSAADNPMKALPRDDIKAAVERSGLKFEGDHGTAQLKAIHQLGEGGAISVMVGAAGAGKTTLLKPLVDAWQKDGRRVYGIALAWRQADDLIDAGIKRDDTRGVNDSRAISVFMNDVKAGKIDLDHKSVVVVDELSLLGTRQGLDLARLRDKHDFQLVMIGDDKQCQSISAGPIIELARKAFGNEAIPEILTTVRQKSERERKIAGLFRDGEAGAALSMKREDGTVELVQGGARRTADRVAALYAERVKANADNPKYSITVSAPTNADAHQLSITIRDKRRELGQVDKKDLVTIKAASGVGSGTDKISYEMALAKGDKVRLFKNISPLKGRGSLGRNGSVLTVLDANKDTITLRNADGKEGVVPWDRLVQRGKVRLAYGEVMTTHTAQGSTSTEHIYAMPQGTKAVNGFSSYSSGTRHEQKSFMLINAGAERAEVRSRRAVNDPRPIEDKDLWANAARNLGYQPVKVTATDFLKHATGVQRGAARAMQQGLQPGESRVRQGLEANTVHVTIRKAREAGAVARVADQLERMSGKLAPTVETLSRTVPEIGVAVQREVEKNYRTLSRASNFTPLTPEKIDELKRSVSITGLVGQRVKLDNHGKGLCHFHDEKTPSFQVDERKGTFHCFGCGKHGDAVTWLRDGLNMSFPEAMDYLSGKSGIELPKADPIKRAAARVPEWTAVVPVPDKAPPLFTDGSGWSAKVYNPKAEERGEATTSKSYRPQHVAHYRDEHGRTAGYVLRIELKDGDKYTPTVTWAVPKSAPPGSDPAKVGRWALVSMGDSRPMYRGEEIAKNPGKTVIIKMGEKKTDTLQAILGNSAVVVSWAGGDNGRAYTEFSILKGANVIVWPDADAGGKAAAVGEHGTNGDWKKGVVQLATEAGALGVKVIVPPAGVPKGWDAGDMIKSGATRADIKAFIAKNAVTPPEARVVFEPQIRAAREKQQTDSATSASQAKGQAKQQAKAVKRGQNQPSKGPRHSL